MEKQQREEWNGMRTIEKWRPVFWRHHFVHFLHFYRHHQAHSMSTAGRRHLYPWSPIYPTFASWLHFIPARFITPPNSRLSSAAFPMPWYPLRPPLLYTQHMLQTAVAVRDSGYTLANKWVPINEATVAVVCVRACAAGWCREGSAAPRHQLLLRLNEHRIKPGWQICTDFNLKHELWSA